MAEASVSGVAPAGSPDEAQSRREAPEESGSGRGLSSSASSGMVLQYEDKYRPGDASEVPGPPSGTEPKPKRAAKSLTRSSTRSEAPSEWGGNRAADQMPPSTSVISQLDNVLLGQFGDMTQEELPEEEAIAPSGSSSSKDRPQAGDAGSGAQEPVKTARGSIKDTMDKTLAMFSLGPAQPHRASAEVKQELAKEHRNIWVWLSENQVFTSSMMTLTFYALFVPDVDLLCGSKDSKYAFSIVTLVVCIFFLIELVVQSLGKKKYFLRAYFWLDSIAMVSLLPDTILFQWMFSSNAFVAGRSSRLTRLIRVASRSSKATRLNRLTRIVRVASCLPRLGALLGRKVKDNDTEKMLEKKLRRVFMFLDEDMDGFISMSAVISCLKKMKADEPVKQAKSWKAKFAQTKSYFSKGQSASAIPSPVPAPSEKSLSAPTPATVTSATASKSTRDYDVGSRSETAAGLKHVEVSTLPEVVDISADDENGVTSMSAKGLNRPQVNSRKGRFQNAVHAKEMGAAVTAESGQGGGIVRRLKKLVTTVSGATPANFISYDLPDYDESEMVDFKTFRMIMLDDEWISSRLRRACQQQLKQGNNMQNLTSRHSEYVAVKVALGVLLLLLVLSMIEPAVEDYSAERGLQHLNTLVRQKFDSQGANDLIDEAVHEQVLVWTDGGGVLGKPRRVLYLDLQQKVYCNEFISGGQRCLWGGENHVWGTRTKLEEIDDNIMDSDFRVDDLAFVKYPDHTDADISADEMDETTMAVVVIFSRGETQQVAVMAILTTVLVIIIILAGIVLLTKDLTFLSRNLLKPLRELADDMESIAQLQLAGVSGTEDTVIEEGTSEVRLIRRTFENMKKAIKSWGKYVPWPVVQLLLRANIEATLEVQEIEVTIFFSDIAGFTSIVESMEPEQSLLLLSRYFNDMSKVIDDHGGVVLEFIGDAIQCIYGAPLINEDHPTSAVKAALRMLAALRRMNEWSLSRSLPEVQIRCGVHTGKVLVGNMGFNMGFHSRMKYGIVGEDAHIPSRLEELNKSYSTNMLISDYTWGKIDQDMFVTRPIDFIHLRHTGSSSEKVHEVIDREKRHARSHPLWPAASLHAEAIEDYRSADFSTAKDKFSEVADLMSEAKGEEDQASMMFVKRCQAYIDNPPNNDWDGTWSGQEPS